MFINKIFFIEFVILLLLYAIYATKASATEENESEMKIFNGSSAAGHRYLKHVALVNFGGLLCGGAILTPTAILTAAQCVTQDNNQPSQKDISLALILAGSLRRQFPISPVGQIREIRTVVVHKKYNNALNFNDIAIIILRKPLIENANTVQRLQLPKRRAAVGTVCTIIGWGDITCQAKGRQIPTEAVYTTLTIMSENFCEQNFPAPLQKGQICASDVNNNSMPCSGDAGSPLICDGEVVGLQSLSAYAMDKPSILTDVLYYRDWINGILAVEDYSERSIGARLGVENLRTIFWLTLFKVAYIFGSSLYI